MYTNELIITAIKQQFESAAKQMAEDIKHGFKWISYDYILQEFFIQYPEFSDKFFDREYMLQFLIRTYQNAGITIKNKQQTEGM